VETVDGRWSQAVVRVTFGVTLGEWSCREGDVRSTPTEAKVTLEAS
jgi:hypothetical protein